MLQWDVSNAIGKCHIFVGSWEVQLAAGMLCDHWQTLIMCMQLCVVQLLSLWYMMVARDNHPGCVNIHQEQPRDGCQWYFVFFDRQFTKNLCFITDFYCNMNTLFSTNLVKIATAFCTSSTVHSTLYIQYTVHSTQYTVHCTYSMYNYFLEKEQKTLVHVL